MLITNFVAGGRDLYVLWDGSRKVNVAGWRRMEEVPAEWVGLARSARRVAVTGAQYGKLCEVLTC